MRPHRCLAGCSAKRYGTLLVPRPARSAAPRRRNGLAALLLAGALVALPAAARAEDDHPWWHCTVRVIHAIAPEAGKAGSAVKLDPKIEKMRPLLSKAPFTAWGEFALLDERPLDLKLKTPQSFQLPNGKTASLTFVEHLPGLDRRAHRVRVQLQIGNPARPALNTVFVVDEGGVVLQAGQPFKNGVLILGTSCAHAAK